MPAIGGAPAGGIVGAVALVAGAVAFVAGAVALVAGACASFAASPGVRRNRDHATAPMATTANAATMTMAGVCDFLGGAAAAASAAAGADAAAWPCLPVAVVAGGCEIGRREQRLLGRAQQRRFGRRARLPRRRVERCLVERRRELVRRLKALVRALGQRLAHHGIHRPGHLHVEPRRRQRVLLQHLVHGGRGRAAEGALARQELVEDDAGREQVGATVDGESHDLLGRHVARRAEHRAHLRHVRRFDVRDAEIGDLDAAVLEQDDVGRLDVAVNDAEPVRVAERVEDPGHHPHDVGGREPLVGFEVALELATADEFHRDVPDALVLADFVDRDDVGVRQPPGSLRLAAKAGNHRLGMLAGELVRANRLERDDALDHGVEPLVDDAHGTAAELAADLVLADPAHLGHASLPGECRSFVGGRSQTRTPVALRRRAGGAARRLICTCCRFPTRSSGSAAGPSCRAKRRPAATATRPSPTSTSRRPPSSPRCSRWRPARWSRH